MIRIAIPYMSRRWSETKPTNRKQLVSILQENAHHVELEWIEAEQGKLMTLGERYTWQGGSGVRRVRRWWLVCISLRLEDTEDWNDISGQWNDAWPLNTWLDSPIFQWLRDTLLPMFVNAPAEYHETDEDEALNGTLLHEPERYPCVVPLAPPPQKAVLFCPPPGQVHYLKWWLTKLIVDNWYILYMYAEMGHNEGTEVQLKFHDWKNPSEFVTTPTICGTGLNLTAGNHMALSQQFWVLNEQRQAFARVFWLGLNIVPQTWLLNTRLSGYDNIASDLNQHFGVSQVRVLHGLMSRLNITMSMLYYHLECGKDHTNQIMEPGDVVPSGDEDEC